MVRKQVLVLNGANMDMLGKRKEGDLGTETLEAIMQELVEYAAAYETEVSLFHSNCEGEIINKLHSAGNCYDGVIMNPGSFGHYSYGIKEAIEALRIPCVEVHLANFFRKPDNKSVLASVCSGLVCGFGKNSYKVALDGIIKIH